MNRLALRCIPAAIACLALPVALGQTQFLPGEVIYDFAEPNDPNSLNTCYPDDWTFFGISQTDFGANADAEDGFGAFQSADWDLCDITQGPNTPGCQWAGCAIGVGPFNHPQCEPGGVSDANLDLSLGTGLSIRVKVNTTVGAGGTLGARMQLQLVDADGTTAVSPRAILMNPAVNRNVPLTEEWRTVNVLFAGLDWAWDNDDAVAGTVPGLDLTHIKSIKIIWRRQAATGVNVFEFDTITLTNEPVVLWADDDLDGDVDMTDVARLQRCVDAALTPECAPLDADFDGDIDIDDAAVFADCMQGPDVTTDFFAWCY